MQRQLPTALIVLLLWGAQAPLCTILCADRAAAPVAMAGCHNEAAGSPAPAEDSPHECPSCVEAPPQLVGWQPASPDLPHAPSVLAARLGDAFLVARPDHRSRGRFQVPPPPDLLLVKASLLL